jgi:DNA-binding transcriptional LysR family regulator
MNTKKDIVATEQLRAFQAVADTGSFTRAAARLGSAQSSISQQVAQLEKRTGRQLVRRTTRRVELTPAGAAMLVYVRSILAMADDARLRLSTPPVEGVVRVGVADEFATTKLASVLGIFRTQHPRFQLQFLTGRNDYLSEALEKGDVDIILAKCHPGRTRGQLLWREQFIWIGQPWVLGKRATPIPLVTYLRPSPTRDLTEGALIAARRTWVVTAQGDNLAGLLAAAQAGLGIMALGRNFVPSGLGEIPADVGLPLLGTLDYVIDHRDRSDDPAAHAFTEILQSFAKNLVSEESAKTHSPPDETPPRPRSPPDR